MADVLMGTDMDQYNTNIKEHSKYLNEYTEILGLYLAMGIGTPTAVEFKALIANPASFVFDKITNGQDVVIGGLKVNKIKAMEILEKPAGYQALKDKIDYYKNNKINFIHYLSHIDVDVDAVVLAQSILDTEMEAAKIWAKTDEEKAAYQMAQDIKSMIETNYAGKFMPSPQFLIQRLLRLETNPFNSVRPQDQAVKINIKRIVGFKFQADL